MQDYNSIMNFVFSIIGRRFYNNSKEEFIICRGGDRNAFEVLLRVGNNSIMPVNHDGVGVIRRSLYVKKTLAYSKNTRPSLQDILDEFSKK